MMQEHQITEVSLDTIKDRIYIIRGKKVMLDKDLAMLYGVSTKRLNEAVKRNLKRFPEDFMFQLNKEESLSFLKSQIATSSGINKI
jgi:ORF6N domain